MAKLTKDEFGALFNDALAIAIANAEQQLKRKLPRDIQIFWHRAGHSGDFRSPAEALDALYLGDDKFYLIIDVAVVAFSNQFTRVFVQPSGHAPGQFERTWNDPPGSGPFKQLISKEIRLVEP